MNQQFVDKSALVTGAGSGMGAATALLLAERGAAVTLVGRRRSKLDEVAGEIRSAGGRALGDAGDVSDPEDVRRAVERTVAEFGGLDLAVNNAGVAGSTGCGSRTSGSRSSSGRSRSTSPRPSTA
jgi:NAD(P)-dependent dehydrogenase (short-subunit alcohol dehydrogenase family)